MVERELPKWKCHKEVWADEVITVRDHSNEYNNCPVENCAHISWELKGGGFVHIDKELQRRGGDNPVGGYFVVYADGYRSWSPKKAFEDGYTKL